MGNVKKKKHTKRVFLLWKSTQKHSISQSSARVVFLGLSMCVWRGKARSCTDGPSVSYPRSPSPLSLRDRQLVLGFSAGVTAQTQKADGTPSDTREACYSHVFVSAFFFSFHPLKLKLGKWFSPTDHRRRVCVFRVLA